MLDCSIGRAGAQNRYEQEIPYRETDGRIVVSAVVDGQRLCFLFNATGGRRLDFLLDVAGRPAAALLEKHERLLQRTDKALPGYPRGGINLTGGGSTSCSMWQTGRHAAARLSVQCDGVLVAALLPARCGGPAGGEGRWFCSIVFHPVHWPTCVA